MAHKKNIRAAKKAAVKMHQTTASAKRAAQAQMVHVSKRYTPKAMQKMIADNGRILKSLGKVEVRSNGTIVYGHKPVAIEVKQRHAKKAKQGVDNDCPLAHALRDSFLGPYITDAHVGNTTVKVWSVLNPNMQVKYTLDSRLYGAVKVYDRTKKWPLEDGIYWLNAYPKSLQPGYRKPKDSKPRTISKRKHMPSRHISLRTDIGNSVAIADFVTKGAKKRA